MEDAEIRCEEEGGSRVLYYPMTSRVQTQIIHPSGPKMGSPDAVR